MVGLLRCVRTGDHRLMLMVVWVKKAIFAKEMSENSITVFEQVKLG